MLFICGAAVSNRLQVLLNFSSNLELCQHQCLAGGRGEGVGIVGKERTKEYCRVRFKALKGKRKQDGDGRYLLSGSLAFLPKLRSTQFPSQGTVEAQQTLYLSYLRFGRSE